MPDPADAACPLERPAYWSMGYVGTGVSSAATPSSSNSMRMIGRFDVAATWRSMSAVLPAHEGAASSTNGGPSGVGLGVGVAVGRAEVVEAGVDDARAADGVAVGVGVLAGAAGVVGPDRAPAAARGRAGPFT